MLRPYSQHMKTGKSRQVKRGEENLLDNLNSLVMMPEYHVFCLIPRDWEEKKFIKEGGEY